MVTGVPTGREERTEIAGPPGTATQIAPLSVSLDLTAEEVGRTKKTGNEARYWPLVDVGWRARLFDIAVPHDRDAVCNGQRLVLVMGDQHRGDPEPSLQIAQFDLHFLPKTSIERTEWLIEQQHGRLYHQCARQSHALLLAPGQLRGHAMLEASKLHKLQCGGDARCCCVPTDVARLQTETDVLGNRHMWKQRVILKQHTDIASMHGDIGDRSPVDEDVARIWMKKPGDHAKCGGLSAAAWAKQRNNGARLDGKRHAIDGARGTELLDQLAQTNGGCHDRARPQAPKT